MEVWRRGGKVTKEEDFKGFDWVLVKVRLSFSNFHYYEEMFRLTGGGIIEPFFTSIIRRPVDTPRVLRHIIW